MIRNIALCFFLSFLINSNTSIASEPIKVAFLDDGPGGFSQIVSKKFLHSISKYYRTDVKVEIWKNSYDEVLQNIDQKAEQYIKVVMEERGYTYLMYIRKIRHRQFAFEVWDKNGILDNIYVPFSPAIYDYLPDIAVNAFISLIDAIGKKLYNSKLY